MKEYISSISEAFLFEPNQLAVLILVTGIFWLVNRAKFIGQTGKTINAMTFAALVFTILLSPFLETTSGKYDELFSLTCESESHNVVEKVNNAFNENDLKITILEAMQIDSENNKCLAENAAEVGS